MERTRKHRKMPYEFCYSCEWCSQILAGTLVISGDVDQRRNGTELILINQMDHGIEWQKKWCSTLPKAVTRYFVPLAPRKSEELRSKGKGKRSLFITTVVKKPLNWFFALILRTFIFCKSAQYLRSSGRFVQRLVRWLRGCGETCDKWRLGINGNPCWTSHCRPSHQRGVAGSMPQDYEHKFEQLPDDQKLFKLCCDTGLKFKEKGQFFITLDEEGPDEMKNSCREYTLPQSEPESRPRVWILGNTKTGPVLDVKVCLHQTRYGFEIMIESLFRDRTVSWVPIVIGIHQYVTESSETIAREIFEHRVTGRPVAKGRPQLKPAVTLSPISIPIRERKLIDIETQRFDQKCFALSKVMIRSLRHGASVPREDDGAARFDDIMEEFRAKFDGSSQWPVDDWITYLAKGGGQKKIEPSLFHTIPVLQSDSETLWNQSRWSYIARQCTAAGGLHRLHLPRRKWKWNIFNHQQWIDPGGRSLKRERQSVFFTAVNPIDGDQSMEEIRCNLDKPRTAPYKNTWRPHQNTVYWCNLKLAQKKGLQFDQRRSHAQSFSTTHYLRFALRKRYAWRRTWSYTTEYVSLKIFLVLCWSRIRKVGRQDRPDQEARESSDHQSVSGSYGETRSGNVDYRIPGIPHSTYSPTTGHESQWNGQTVDSAVRESPAQGVFPAGVETHRKDKCVQREVEEVDFRHEQYGDLRALRNLFQETTPRLCFKLWNWCGRSLKPRKGPNSSTRRTMTPYQFPVMASKRTSSMVPNMDLPNGNDCTTKPRRCCRELANPSMVGTKQFWKDGTRMTITQVLSDIGWTEE